MLFASSPIAIYRALICLKKPLRKRQKCTLLFFTQGIPGEKIVSPGLSKEEKSFGFCVFVYILCVFVYILCVFVYVFLGSQSQGSYISRDFVVDL